MNEFFEFDYYSYEFCWYEWISFMMIQSLMKDSINSHSFMNGISYCIILMNSYLNKYSNRSFINEWILWIIFYNSFDWFQSIQMNLNIHKWSNFSMSGSVELQKSFSYLLIYYYDLSWIISDILNDIINITNLRLIFNINTMNMNWMKIIPWIIIIPIIIIKCTFFISFLKYYYCIF